MFNQQESRGAIVGNLSTLALLFCLILALVVIYTLFSATLIVMRLRSLRTIKNDNFFRKSLLLINHRSANLRQIIVAVFCLFGLTFFIQIHNAYWTQENGDYVGT